MERVAEAVGRDAVHRRRPSAGARRGRRVARRGRDGAPDARPTRGARSQPTRARSREHDDGMSASAGQGRQADVGERMVEPRTAERADDDDPVGSRVAGRPGRRARCPTRPCPVGDRSIGDAGRLERGQRRRRRASRRRRPRGRSATPSAAAWRAPPSAAMTKPMSSAQPGQAASRSARDGRVTIGEDQDDHRPRMLPGPMLDSAPCPTRSTILPSAASSRPPRARA